MLGGASTQIVKWPCRYFSITFQTRWVTKNVEMSSLVGFVSRTCSSRHFWGFSKLEQGCPRSWRPEPDPNLIPNVGFPIIASQHFFQKLSSSFGQDVKNLVLDQRSPEFAANSGISGLRTPTNRWFARGSGAKILVPNQKIPEFAANSGILGFGTATKRSQAKAMNFAVKIRQPQNSRVRPELWNLPVQLFQLTAGSA